MIIMNNGNDVRGVARGWLKGTSATSGGGEISDNLLTLTAVSLVFDCERPIFGQVFAVASLDSRVNLIAQQCSLYLFNRNCERVESFVYFNNFIHSFHFFVFSFSLNSH